jgi:fatty-acyl-CoA synthase
VPVSQVYGATETGPVSLVLDPHEAIAHEGTVGKEAQQVHVKLIDAQGQPVAPGEVGEIWLQAPNLARGYWKDEHNPAFADGWYRTGDLAARDAQGFYTVVGRLKDMIISGGENIYPAELENLLAGHSDVAECAVVGVPDATWGEIPVLAAVTKLGETALGEAFAARAQGQLARYKWPKRYVVLPALPKTALGKVIKAELRDMLLAG